MRSSPLKAPSAADTIAAFAPVPAHPRAAIGLSGPFPSSPPAAGSRAVVDVGAGNGSAATPPGCGDSVSGVGGPGSGDTIRAAGIDGAVIAGGGNTIVLGGTGALVTMLATRPGDGTMPLNGPSPTATGSGTATVTGAGLGFPSVGGSGPHVADGGGGGEMISGGAGGGVLTGGCDDRLSAFGAPAGQGQAWPATWPPRT